MEQRSKNVGEELIVVVALVVALAALWVAAKALRLAEKMLSK